jgi:phage FluMu protein Com
MAIEFRCAHCHKLLRVGDDAAGKKARCPDCGTIQEACDSGGSLTGFSPRSESASFSNPSQSTPAPANPFSEKEITTSPFSQDATTNPYLSPVGPGVAPPASRDVIQDKVRLPAVAMLVVAGLTLFTQLATCVVMIVNVRGRVGPAEILINMIGIGLGIAVNGVIVLGAFKMQRLENYPLAVTAAVLSIIPCTSTCCLLSIPIGIWSMAILSDPQVKQAFR